MRFVWLITRDCPALPMYILLVSFRRLDSRCSPLFVQLVRFCDCLPHVLWGVLGQTEFVVFEDLFVCDHAVLDVLGCFLAGEANYAFSACTRVDVVGSKEEDRSWRVPRARHVRELVPVCFRKRAHSFREVVWESLVRVLLDHRSFISCYHP